MSRLLALTRFTAANLTPLRSYPCRSVQNCHIICDREVVGFGWNGNPCYADLLHYPFPAIRWRENAPEVMCLRAKEKGDWKKLTLEEKKFIYRSSFCKTFAEMKAPTGEWKFIVGASFLLVAFSFVSWVIMRLIGSCAYPETYTDEERRTAILKRFLELRAGAVWPGLSYKFDFDKRRWR